MTDVVAAPSRSQDGPGTGALPELVAVDHLVGSTTVDGVPVLFAHRDGPASAGIMFRVGWADEPLARNGITHLVEHLALHSQGLSDVHHNGSTSDSWTHFHATGSPSEVVRYVNDVCAALRDLPVGRMEVEKQILRTEAASRSFGAGERHRLERYGAGGPGLTAFDGFGLNAVTEGDIREWVSERFTTDNAVVWITTGTVPEGLDLRLSRGERKPVPHWAEAAPLGPSYFVGAPGGVLIDAIVPRSTTASLFSRVASRALFRVLRQESGYSYTAHCDYEPIDAERARITVFADASVDKQAAVVGAIVDVFAALRAGNIDQNDIQSAKEAIRQNLDVPFPGAALLPATAASLLLGADTLDPVDLVRESDAVTAADLAVVAEAMWRGALAQVPEGALDWAGLAAVPAWSPAEVVGRTHPRFGENDGALVIGPEGVTVRFPGGPVTVRFDQCQAIEVWPDGARRLTGADGMSVVVEPTLHANLSAAVIRTIDAAVPIARRVPRPARDPESIPQRPAVMMPNPKEMPKPPRFGWRGFGVWSLALGFFGGLFGLIGLIAASTDLAANGATDMRMLGFVFPLCVLVVSSGLLFAAYQRDRWMRYDAHGSSGSDLRK